MPEHICNGSCYQADLLMLDIIRPLLDFARLHKAFMASPLPGPMQENEVPLTVTAHGTSGIDSKQSGKAKRLNHPKLPSLISFAEISIYRNKNESIPITSITVDRDVTGSLWGPRRARRSCRPRLLCPLGTCRAHAACCRVLRRGWRRAKGSGKTGSEKAENSELHLFACLGSWRDLHLALRSQSWRDLH